MHASSSNRPTPKLSMFKKALTNFLEDDNGPYVLGGDVTTKKFKNNKDKRSLEITLKSFNYT